MAAALPASAQKVTIAVEGQPLNKVLLDLKKSHDIQLSFNDKQLGSCLITDNSSYENPEAAIASWVASCKLSYKIRNGVFVIFNKKGKGSAGKTPAYSFQCQVIDKENGEPLPFSTVQISSSGFITDVNGNFAFNAQDSMLGIGISHLGYYSLDTTISPRSQKPIPLTPKVVGLQEVVVEAGAEAEKMAYVPAAAGFQKLNHRFTAFLPGNNNNTLFNALRLQPGILAAGEQTQDFMIWGSYKGETQIIWDGITLFNTSSFNDHIGVVNPLMVKDIEVHKGGYNVRWGDRVGGVVNITSRSGYGNGFHSQFNINNQTASGRVNIPVSKRSALQAAFRKTYYNKLGVLQKKAAEDYNTYFNFGDLNCKYSGYTKNGDTYYLSLLGSNDAFTEYLDKDQDDKTYLADTEQGKIQRGGALFYGKKWKKGGLTNTTLAYSSLESTFLNHSDFKDIAKGIDSNTYNSTANGIAELSLKTEHHFPTNNTHGLRIGGGFIQNTSTFYQDSTKQILKFSADEISRVNAYVMDNFTLTPSITLEPSIRIDLPLNDLTPYIQPRVSLHFKPTPTLRFNLRYGIYHQFIAENAMVDQFNNYLYYWSIADIKATPVLKGTHYVAGMSWNTKPGHIKLEGFYKNTDGLIRYFWDGEAQPLMGSNGKSRAYGIDCYFQKKWGKLDFWAAYTWSKTEESFNSFETAAFQRAPHDQRHEAKGAGILNLHPFFFSINYIYGSGFPNAAHLNSNIDFPAYNRLDIAFLYKFHGKKIQSEVGFSILNLLNNENIRYNNFYSFPDSDLPYSHATPFTPLVFLNIGI